MATPLGPGSEFDRIRRIAEALGPLAPGLGSDCAVLPEGAGRIVVSTDLSIEGVHLRTDWLGLEEIGWRAASAALSDLAAAAAAPVGLMASVGVPSGTPDTALVEVMRGVGAAAGAVGALVLGGDLSRSPQWLLDITVLGRAERPLSRRGALPGDGVWVSGWLGLARAALVALERGESPDAEARRAFARPEPRVAPARWLAAAGAHAMLDLSDGLAGDAGHLAAASDVAVELALDRLPLAPAVVRMATRLGEAPARFAAAGGEDYELLVALPPAFGAPEAARALAETGVPLTRIGEVVAGRGARLTFDAHPVLLTGFDHFA